MGRELMQDTNDYTVNWTGVAVVIFLSVLTAGMFGLIWAIG